MKKLSICLIMFLSMFVARADAEFRENDETSVREHFVMRDKTTGVIDTGVVVANLEMYYIDDAAAMSADVFTGSLAGDTTTWVDGECRHMGNGVYRTDWPNAAFDGGIGTKVQLILKDGDGDAFAEIMAIELSPPVDTTTVGGATPISVADMADGVWDELLTGASHNISTSAGRRLRGIQEYQGYALGAIWVDTLNGTAGTTDYENGTVEYPVDTWADALTIAGSLSMKRFHIANGSTIQLSANSDKYEFLGWEWTLDLNSQSMANAYVNGAVVTGTMTGTSTRFFYCKMGQGATVTVPACGMKECALMGSIVLTSNSNYILDGCFAGTASPDIDLGSGVANTTLLMRHYSGDIELKNMNTSGTDVVDIEGYGHVTMNANCAGGTLSLMGNFKVTDNASAAVTMVYDDDTTDITSILSATESAVTTTVNTVTSTKIFTLVAGIQNDNAFKYNIIAVQDITDSHWEVRLITRYVGATRTVTLDKALTFTPVNGDVVEISKIAYYKSSGGW